MKMNEFIRETIFAFIGKKMIKGAVLGLMLWTFTFGCATTNDIRMVQDDLFRIEEKINKVRKDLEKIQGDLEKMGREMAIRESEHNNNPSTQPPSVSSQKPGESRIPPITEKIPPSDPIVREQEADSESQKGDMQKEWLSATKSDSIESYLEFLKRFRESQYVPKAVKRIFLKASTDRRSKATPFIPFDRDQGQGATLIEWVPENASMAVFGTPETRLYIIRDSSNPLVFDQEQGGLKYKSGKGIVIRIRDGAIKDIWRF